MSERKAVSINVKSCCSLSADSNDKYILPLATTTIAAWRILAAEIRVHYICWGGGYDMTSSSRYYKWFYSGRGGRKKKKRGVTAEHQ